MNVENQSGKVADEEHEDDGDEDDAKTFLLLLIPFPQLLDGQVDLDVKTGDEGEGDDPEEDESHPAVIDSVVEIVVAEI